jgi:fluoride exporter
MKIILAIGLGSFIGGVGRYLISQFMQTKFIGAFPYGTLTVNVIGCFLIGIVYGISSKGNFNPTWQLFLTTGILGGFTTFSAFSIETVNLMRSGQTGTAMAYVTLSLALGILATFGGFSLAKMF